MLGPSSRPVTNTGWNAQRRRQRSTQHTRIIVTHYGGPDELRVVEEERPEPRDGEVRVRVLAAGVSLPDVMMREGLHPETPRLPFTPGWDLVGVVDRLGDGVSGIEPGQIVAALPIFGSYAEFVCLQQRELVPVPPGLDAGEAVSLILNYVTAYQMMHRSVDVGPGQRVLIHGAAGGVGTALLQLGRLAGLEMYGTCSARGASAVSDLGGIPIDYRDQDFVKEIHRLTGEGVDVVFDGIGGAHIWRSRNALRPGGSVVAYGLTASVRGKGVDSGHSSRRHRFREIRIFALYIAGGWLLPGRKRVVPYSIQWLKRVRPALFRQDLIALFDLLRQRKIEPLIAHRFPFAEARQAHELLGKGGVIGKIVLVRDESSLESSAGGDCSPTTWSPRRRFLLDLERPRSLEHAAHGVVPLVAGVLEHALARGAHRNRDGEGTRERGGGLDRVLVEQPALADRGEALDQVQVDAGADGAASRAVSIESGSWKAGVLSVKPVVSTTSVSPSQWPRESPDHRWIPAGRCGRPSSGTTRAS